MSTMTETLPEIDTEVTEPDGKAHYARINQIMFGGPVVALCGKKYVPTILYASDVADREICKTCAQLFEILKSMD